MRLTFVCSRAEKFPIIIVSSAQAQTSGIQRSLSGRKDVMNTRKKTAKAAAFGPADIKAETGAAAPW